MTTSCHILTAVWGAWHSEVFLSLQLPSLLAPGNLPALHAAVPTTYRIQTSQSDAPRFEAAPGVAALRRILPVEIEALPDDDFRHPVETHLAIWHDGVDRARAAGAYFMALPADMLWADGAFSHLAGRLASGEAAVYALFIRATLETIAEELGWRPGGPPLTAGALPPRDLVGLALRHLHPLHAAYRRDSAHFPFHPEYIVWPVRDEGLLMRSLATTALIFAPQRCAVDHHFSLLEGTDLDTVGFIDDSDDFFGVSLTPLLKDLNWFFTWQDLDIETVGAWWDVFDGHAHDRLADRRIRFHAVEPTPSAWRQAELRSDFLVGQCRIARDLIQIGRFFHHMGYRAASEHLALAIATGRLRRRIRRRRGPFTVFCPADAALARPGEGEAASLEHILAHVVEDKIEAPADDVGAPVVLQSLAGSPINITGGPTGMIVNGISVIATHHLPNGYLVHIIDGVFDKPTSLPVRPQSTVLC